MGSRAVYFLHNSGRKPSDSQEWTENTIGPRMEPCGTPQVMGTVVDENAPISTEKLLFVKYQV